MEHLQGDACRQEAGGSGEMVVTIKKLVTGWGVTYDSVKNAVAVCLSTRTMTGIQNGQMDCTKSRHAVIRSMGLNMSDGERCSTVGGVATTGWRIVDGTIKICVGAGHVNDSQDWFQKTVVDATHGPGRKLGEVWDRRGFGLQDLGHFGRWSYPKRFPQPRPH